MKKKKLKKIPTEKLVKELLRRDKVRMYACDLYKRNYRVQIEDNTEFKREPVRTPNYCDVIIIERTAQ